jgi:maltooligosyltrehalose trehalohydrolase
LSALKLAAGMTLCAPNIPLLFMGEEYGETAPFLYFTSHTDQELGRAVREGRRQEFAGFAWEPAVPDPQDPQTFHRSILNHHLRGQEPNRALLQFYHDVIALRKRSSALQNCSKEHLEVTVSSDQQALMIHRWQPGEDAVLLFASFALTTISLVPTLPPGVWRYILNSDDRQYEGTAQSRFPTVLQQNERPSILLSPFTFSVYGKDPE